MAMIDIRALLTAAVIAVGLTCRGQEPDWAKSERDVTTTLWVSNVPIATLARTVSTQPVEDAQAAIFKFGVLLRAGMNEEAAGALQELKRLRPALAGYEVQSMHDEACKYDGASEIPRLILDLFQPNAVVGGHAQAASARPTGQSRVIEAEAKSPDAPEYWLEQAQDYRSRKEPDREEEALKTGLSLTKPQLPPERGRKGHSDPRTSLLSEYVRFLERHGREREAIAVLRQELATAPALAESAVQAVRLLAFDFNEWINADDDVLWNWLAERPTWGFPEQRLLWRMIENVANATGALRSPLLSATQPSGARENVPDAKLDEHLTRAEKLADNGDHTRNYAVDWIMNRMGFAKRSIPQLKAAVETAKDKESRERASFALFESLLDTGDWREAEVVFPEALRGLTAHEIPDWHSRLALAAARNGDKADALRLWIRSVNASPTATRGLKELAILGLGDDLAAFYRSMQREMPSSYAPAKALELLEAK